MEATYTDIYCREVVSNLVWRDQLKWSKFDFYLVYQTKLNLGNTFVFFSESQLKITKMLKGILFLSIECYE